MTKVSIIITCFNLGKYLDEAVSSALLQTYGNVEVILVNDGSTDTETIRKINLLDKSKIKIINTDNQGLANARNNGIRQATGEYILPLDGDDKIDPFYTEKAVTILDENENIGIVYCQANFFEAVNSAWILPEYNFSMMLLDNMIFASSFFRKKDWEKVGGYNSNMIYGWEDYDLWLSIIELKRDVYKIPEELFSYRRHSDSMSSVMTKEQFLYSYKKIVNNHKNLYLNNIEHLFEHIYSLRDLASAITDDKKSLETRISQLKDDLIAKQSKLKNLNVLFSLIWQEIKSRVMTKLRFSSNKSIHEP